MGVNGYVLMTNQFCVRATHESLTGVARLMQAARRRYAEYFNGADQRTGSLGEGVVQAAVCQVEV